MEPIPSRPIRRPVRAPKMQASMSCHGVRVVLMLCCCCAVVRSSSSRKNLVVERERRYAGVRVSKFHLLLFMFGVVI